MKSVIKFLGSSFKGRCRTVIMADEPFIRKGNLANLEIHLPAHPQSVWGSKTKGKQCNSVNSNRNQLINAVVSTKDEMRDTLAHFLDLCGSLDRDDLTAPLVFLCYIYRSDIWKVP